MTAVVDAASERVAVRALVLGAGGFLGANVVRSLSSDGVEVVRHARVGPGPTTMVTLTGDLLDPAVIGALLETSMADVVINCAALADVDRCEADPERSRAINTDLPQRLAAACSARDVRLVHVSTDAVFDGVGGPFVETDRPGPLSIYGRDKLAGETAVLAEDPLALVVRTNVVGWSPTGRRSLLEYFHSRLAAGEPAPGFVDLAFRPLPAPWFWPACMAFQRAGMVGVRHATGPELLTKFEFGRRVARVFGFDERLVIPVDSASVTRPAARAPSLDVIPSGLPDGTRSLPDSLDAGLEELRSDAALGVRQEFASLLDEGHRP